MHSVGVGRAALAISVGDDKADGSVAGVGDAGVRELDRAHQRGDGRVGDGSTAELDGQAGAGDARGAGLDGANDLAVVRHGRTRNTARGSDAAHRTHQQLVVAGIVIAGVGDRHRQITACPHTGTRKIGLVGDADAAAVDHLGNVAVLDKDRRDRTRMRQRRRAGADHGDGVDSGRGGNNAAAGIPAGCDFQIEAVAGADGRLGACRIQQRNHCRLIGCSNVNDDLGGTGTGDGVAVAQGVGVRRRVALAGKLHFRQRVVCRVGGEVGAGDGQIGGVGVIKHAGELVVLCAQCSGSGIADS